MGKHRFKIHRVPKLSKAVAVAVAETRESTPLETSNVSDTRTESEWVIDIEKKLNQAQDDEDDGTRLWPKVSIYRIPKYLRDINEIAYTPQMVSLGPYHHGQQRLSGMERHKWRALRHVLKQTGHRIERYLAAVQEIEVRARACYEGPVELSSYDFVEMLLLDSTFILELFRGTYRGFARLGYSPSDPIFAFCAGMTPIRRDVIMLENQIPLFVLDRIHAIQCPDGPRISVASLSLRFFKHLVPRDGALPSTRAALADQSGLHCLDVLRRSLLAAPEETKSTPSPGCIKKWFHPRVPGCIKTWFRPRVPGCIKKWWKFHPKVPGSIKKWFNPRGRSRDKNRQRMIHCVTELKEAGVKFKVKETDRICDIDFNNGVLEIPRLLVQDSTKHLFMNLIAFEQCHRYCCKGITLYTVLMDYLINSPADVAYLQHCRIVDNYLGSDVEVAELFNRLGIEVVFSSKDRWLSKLTEKINRYYNQPWNAWRASLTHNYFNSPWSIISFIAATVLVLLTLMQTFYAVYAYYVPPS